MMKPRLLLSAAAALLAGALVPACSSAPKKDSDPETSMVGAPKTPVRPTALSRTDAQLRSRQVARVAYGLWFGLDSELEDYEGRAVINFELRPKGQDVAKTLAVDFEEGRIRSLSLNGKELEIGPDVYDGHRIRFKSGDLKAGNNRVEVAFTHKYSKNGTGLHRFKDEVDGRVYLYSNFEPYDAHRMFPCFDQPDLKASYELTVEAPPEWQVISNTVERGISNVDGRKSWQFPPSPLLSTYVFALHAGPYAAWKGDAGGIPMRLFARQSLKQYVEHEEWLEVTRRGLEWFSVYFGYPYPYSKYDQIIVPDFNAGAMENAGAVTFSERYVNRSRVTTDRRRGRADTILHEMAHMWFGDLVTMRWWNGLWLNESFATFMAAKAVDEATEFKGSWQDFFGGMKQWAYWEDQLVTTHPIEGPVHDTDQAESIFDGITYGKGAATLKQLSYLLASENGDDFREGLQRYFQKFALRNTTVTDFIKMLQEASGKDLLKWQKSWLQTAGVNTLRAEWACAAPENAAPGTDGAAGPAASKLASLKLLQSAPEQGSPELRSHRAQVALYRLRKGKLAPYKTVTVSYAGAATPVSGLEDAACPDFVYPNHGDYDYAKVELDPVSLAAARSSLSLIDDPFARQMIWNNLWEMVIDGKLKAQEYAEIVLAQGGSETDTQVLARLLGSLATSDLGDASVLKFVAPGPDRDRTAERIEKFARAGLGKAPAGSDIQLIWYRSFLEAAASREAAGYAHALLSGKARIKGLKIDQERRWEILRTLARLGWEGSAELIAAELKADNTDMGQKEAIRAEASLPSPANKRLWLDRIVKQELPYPKLRPAMGSFYALGQEESARVAVAAYFETVPKLAGLADEEFARRFASSMFPSLCDAEIARMAGETLAKNPGLPAFALKALKIGKQEEERCVRARAAGAGK